MVCCLLDGGCRVRVDVCGFVCCACRCEEWVVFYWCKVESVVVECVELVVRWDVVVVVVVVESLLVVVVFDVV